MDDLPEELFDNILKYLKDFDPISLYKLKLTNKIFYKKINEIQNNYDKNYININLNLQNKINKLCFRNNLFIFKWLFKNNIFLTDNNIINLVSNNRLDVLKECIKYNEILKTIFNNKYSLFIFNNERIIHSESPLIIAGKNGYFDIIKLLIEISIFKNPFHGQLDLLIEELIKYDNKIIIKYLITYHYDKFINHFFTFNKILKGLNNSEDIIFYLIQSKKININNNFIFECIEKNYTKACIFTYNNFYNNLNLILSEELIKRIFLNDNIELLDFFIKKNPSQLINVKKYLKELDISKCFFLHILDNYLKYIHKDYPIIEIYLKYDNNYDIIENLVNNNYIITKNSIIISLEFEDIKIFKLLSENYLKY